MLIHGYEYNRLLRFLKLKLKAGDAFLRLQVNLEGVRAAEGVFLVQCLRRDSDNLRLVSFTSPTPPSSVVCNSPVETVSNPMSSE